MRKLLLIPLLSAPLLAAPCERLDLDTAWQRVLCHSPSLSAADEEVEILRGQAEQLGTRVNPFLEVEAENLGVDHPTEDTEPPQTTFRLEQMLELGGKRSARVDLACAQAEIAACEAHIEREDARLDLISAFIDVRIAEERVALAEKRHALVEGALDAVQQQVCAGKVSPIQERRAHIEAAHARIAMREAYSAYEQAKLHLASLWGGACLDFDHVSYALDPCAPPECLDEVLAGFCQTPDFYKAERIVAAAARNLTLQKVNAVPNVTVMAGYRRYHDSHTGGWVVGAEMPIPFFDRNQGNIRSACAERSQAEYNREEVLRQAREKLIVTYEKVCAAYEEARLMRCNILQEAEQTCSLTKEGYERGKLDYLELLETEKVLCEIEESYLDLLQEYHQNRAVLARLSGLYL